MHQQPDNRVGRKRLYFCAQRLIDAQPVYIQLLMVIKAEDDSLTSPRFRLSWKEEKVAVMALASPRVTGAFQCPIPKIKIVPRTKPKIASTIFSPSVISLNWRIFSPPIYHQRCGYLAYYLPHYLAYYLPPL